MSLEDSLVCVLGAVAYIRVMRFRFVVLDPKTAAQSFIWPSLGQNGSRFEWSGMEFVADAHLLVCW